MGKSNLKSANGEGLSKNQAVVYAIIVYQGGVYLEKKTSSELQLVGKKISLSEDPMVELVKALKEKLGVDFLPSQLRPVSSKNYADLTSEDVKSQRCFIYKVELSKNLETDKICESIFHVGIDAIKNDTGHLEIKEITKKIIQANC